VLGWSEQEVAGVSFFDLLHPDDVECTRADVTRQARTKFRFLNCCPCKGGSYRWISWAGVSADGLVYCSGRVVVADLGRKVREMIELGHIVPDP